MSHTTTAFQEKPRFKGLEFAIGNTPLLEINLRYKTRPRVVYAKAEHVNLTGSIKDRMAFHILRNAYETGAIHGGETIAEATSGNTGIAFSALGRALGHPVVIFMPDWMSRERVDLIRSLGPSIVQVSKEEGGFLDDAVRWEAPALVRRLERLREDMREVERNMTRAAQRLPRYRSVISVPGVGPVLGAMILAAIGDPNRFDHPGQVLRLAGLDLSASRSGKNSERVVPKISKQGKATLRFALVHAALVAVHTHPAERAYHADLLKGRQQERGIAMKRAVKVAAKLLTVTWTLMCRQEVFDRAHRRAVAKTAA